MQFHMYRWQRQAVTTVLMLSLLFALVLDSHSQVRFPADSDPHVIDQAGILTPPDLSEAKRVLRELKSRSGIEVLVVTINSIADYAPAGESIESYSQALFNHYGIGDAGLNNGILLLVALDDRELRIELGHGYGVGDERVSDEIVNNILVPHFRDGQPSSGILSGVRAISSRFAVAKAAETTPSTPVPPRSPSSREAVPKTGNNNSVPVVLVGLLLLGSGGIWAFRNHIRYRERRCGKCQRKMMRVDEFDDDVYLTEGQRVEEAVSSVDYDVWNCRNCGEHELHRYGFFFSGYRRCSNCSYKTMSVNREHMYAATYDRQGEIWVNKYCYHCEFRDRRIIYTPRLERDEYHHRSRSYSGSSSRSSSSSSSSRGGGRSSGRGSTGKW